MHIGLNAHLLSGGTGYRTAGIHGYIDGLLRHLPGAVPEDFGRLSDARTGKSQRGRHTQHQTTHPCPDFVAFLPHRVLSDSDMGLQAKFSVPDEG